jgi:O-antigen/teichoic acid export membrane protein
LLRKLGPAAIKHHALNLTLQAPPLILPVLVTILLSATTNAWFYVSWNLASLANIVSSALTVTLYAVSSAQPSVLARKIRLTLSLAFLACVLANCVLLFDTRQVLDLFGHSYAEQATWSLRILSLESFPFIIKNHYIAVCRIQGRVAYAALLTIATGLLELGGAALGAHLGGLTGLSLGWFAAICVEAVFMSRAVYKAARPINYHYTLHTSKANV